MLADITICENILHMGVQKRKRFVSNGLLLMKYKALLIWLLPPANWWTLQLIGHQQHTPFLYWTALHGQQHAGGVLAVANQRWTLLNDWQQLKRRHTFFNLEDTPGCQTKRWVYTVTGLILKFCLQSKVLKKQIQIWLTKQIFFFCFCHRS